MKPIFLSLAAAFTLFFQLQVKAQSAPPSKKVVNERIRQIENNLLPNIHVESDTPMNITQRMAFYKIKGLSVAVVHNYKLEWAKGYGLADDSLQTPVTTHTLFQAGSVSKSLNAVGVLKLVQDKKINLYADINDYLTSWKFTYDSLSKDKKISVANLLSHTAGLNVHGFGGYRHGLPVPSVVQVLSGQKPANTPRIKSMYQPGLRYEYSGGGITISQLIVMDVTGQPYDKYMYDNVLKPLGMTASTYTQPLSAVKPGLLASGYRGDGKQVPGKYNIYPEQAAAGLWTNPSDLTKYIIETQLAYAGKSAKVLNQQSTQLMLTPYIDKSAALGVFIRDLGGVKYFTHDGADNGFRSSYYGSLDGGNGIAVMVNSDNGIILDEIINSVARAYQFKGLDRSKLRKHVVVADSVLQGYTGKYEIAPHMILTITRDSSQLYGQVTGQGKTPIFPESQNKFFLKVADVEIEFIKDDEGKVIKAVIFEDGPHEAKRLKQ
jgi:CubicO group peptidase (beta-lactamase class C family)